MWSILRVGHNFDRHIVDYRETGCVFSGGNCGACMDIWEPYDIEREILCEGLERLDGFGWCSGERVSRLYFTFLRGTEDN